MIRVRVDWHAQCPGCRTQLAVDYFEDSFGCAICPWCGHIYRIERGPDQAEIREYIGKAIRKIESKVNDGVLV